MKTKDKDAFLNSIRGTTPIIKTNRAGQNITLESPIQKTKTIIKNYIETKKNPIKETLKHSSFELEKTNINKKLKKGKIPIDKKVDFHGLSVLDAELLFTESVRLCYDKNLRCILFVTGKGILKKPQDTSLNSRLYYGKIRNSFGDWTKKNELQKYILSVEQANIDHGADGAFFVYLRKKKL